MLSSQPLGADTPPGPVAAILLCARADLRRARGDHEGARADYLAAARRTEWLPYPHPGLLGWRPGLALAELALGRRGVAQAAAEKAVEVAREAGSAYGIGLTLRVKGVVAGAEGVALLHESVATLAGTTARLEHARSLVELGAALRRRGDRRGAREPLRAGLELAHGCGARPLEERARVELAATGARPRKAVRSGVEALTPSELRVARLAAGGRTNREIAQELFVTVKTVEFHLRHCYQKLEIERRNELAKALP
jgi:DNA-binding CsgD family transcriptional regulator